MKKFLSFLTAFAVLPAFAFATVADSCGQEFTYTKTTDFSDARVSINFESGDHQIDVSAASGYEVIKVELDVDDDGHAGYHTYATAAVTNLNPSPGNDINSAKVTVKKTCPDVCSNIDGAQYEVPEGMEESEGQCVTPSTEPTEPEPSTPSEPAPKSYGGGGGMCHPNTGWAECMQPANYKYHGLPVPGLFGGATIVDFEPIRQQLLTILSILNLLAE